MLIPKQKNKQTKTNTKTKQTTTTTKTREKKQHKTGRWTKHFIVLHVYGFGHSQESGEFYM